MGSLQWNVGDVLPHLLILITSFGIVWRYTFFGQRFPTQELLSVPILLIIPVYLLGLVEDLVPKWVQMTFLSITLFYAHKSIILY